jgi:hypothetical protein
MPDAIRCVLRGDPVRAGSRAALGPKNPAKRKEKPPGEGPGAKGWVKNDLAQQMLRHPPGFGPSPCQGTRGALA